jgi:hypothetical protein
MRLPSLKKRARYTVNGRKRSLRDIAADLAAQDHVMTDGKPCSATAVSRMLAS